MERINKAEGFAIVKIFTVGKERREGEVDRVTFEFVNGKVFGRFGPKEFRKFNNALRGRREQGWGNRTILRGVQGNRIGSHENLPINQNHSEVEGGISLSENTKVRVSEGKDSKGRVDLKAWANIYSDLLGDLLRVLFPTPFVSLAVHGIHLGARITRIKKLDR